jgi:hypothetical protein
MFTSARGLPWQKVDVILWPSPYPTPASRTLTFPPEIEGSKSYVARAIFLKLFVADEVHLNSQFVPQLVRRGHRRKQLFAIIDVMRVRQEL